MTREEAINEIRSWNFLNGREKEAIQTLVPELCESEDERIRKGLIVALKASKTVGELKFVLPYPTREECITYLEKQKEQKPAEYQSIPKHRGKSYSAYLDLSLNEVEACMLRYFHSAESRKNDFEINEDTRKYAKDLIGIIQRSDEPQIVDAFKNYTDNGITITCGEFEAKPMFKEGDWVVYDGVLGHAILKIKDIKDGRYTFVDNESTLLAEDSGKYLRPLTPNDIKPAEWSEEDDMLMDELESYILYDKEFNDEQKSWRIKRLKSLRPSWKPSEEQMSMLLAVIRDPNNAGSESCSLALKSIYEQLKKMM